MYFLNRFREFIMDEMFEVKIYDNKVDVINYTEIDSIESNKIIIRNVDEVILIKGSNLVVNRLLSDEVLITGQISNVEFR